MSALEYIEHLKKSGVIPTFLHDTKTECDLVRLYKLNVSVRDMLKIVLQAIRLQRKDRPNLETVAGRAGTDGYIDGLGGTIRIMKMCGVLKNIRFLGISPEEYKEITGDKLIEEEEQCHEL